MRGNEVTVGSVVKHRREEAVAAIPVMAMPVMEFETLGRSGGGGERGSAGHSDGASSGQVCRIFGGNTWILGIARFKTPSALRKRPEEALDDATAERIEDRIADPERLSPRKIKELCCGRR